MDLYQIFITHNPPWTAREKVCFFMGFLAAAVLLYYLLKQKKIVRTQAVAGLLLFLFLGIVFGSTVFARMPDGKHRFEPVIFWSWNEVYHGSREMLKENILNMILLFPMGILLPVVFHKTLSWKKGFLAGFIVSVTIEICQLVFCRGLFEWDDMVHNGLGCMIGCILSEAVIKRAASVYR